MDIDFVTFIEWFKSLNLPYGSIICTFLSTIFSLVIMVVQIKKYKYQKNQGKDVNLKYRKESYLTKKDAPKYTQSFDKVVPVYELNSAGDDLVVVGTKDLQELVQSSRECGLDIVFEKYGVIPTSPAIDSKESSDVFDATDIRDDFEYLSDVFNDVEELRQRYDMPTASAEDLFKHINSLKSNLDKKIQDELINQNNKKEGVENGKV